MEPEPKIIRELRAAKPHKRIQILKRQHRRNVNFLARHFPQLSRYVDKVGIGRFKVGSDDHFLSITDSASGGLLHPPGRLAEFSSQLGGVDHGGWWEYQLNGALFGGAVRTEHERIVQSWTQSLATAIPDMPPIESARRFALPSLGKGRYFSPLVFCLGINTGLHLEYLLNRAELQDMILVEPDPERFALSCLFVDYTDLHRRLGHLYLFVGDTDVDRVLSHVSNAFPVSSQVYVRMLRAYDNPLFQQFADRARLHFRRNTFLPVDRQLRGMRWAVSNLRGGRPVWSGLDHTGSDARVVVVGAGPSLDDGLAWLKRFRDRLVIIAAVSAVRPLRAAGIDPDFQCALDYEYPESSLKRMELNAQVPLIASVNADTGLLKRFSMPLLFAASMSANVAVFPSAWRYTGPTSGNLALAAAIQFKPAEIYLIGMDLAFPRNDRSHASGSHHDFRHSGEDTGASVANTNHPAEAGEWVTTPFLNNARVSVEAAIAASGIPVRNLSHGALVQGAVPDYPDSVIPPAPQDLSAHLAAFREAFRPHPSVRAYEVDPDAVLDVLSGPLQDLGRDLQWRQYLGTLDAYWDRVKAIAAANDSQDNRLEIYRDLLRHVMLCWYQFMLWAPDRCRQALYLHGRKQLDDLLTSLRWPEEADAFMRGDTRL